MNCGIAAVATAAIASPPSPVAVVAALLFAATFPAAALSSSLFTATALGGSHLQLPWAMVVMQPWLRERRLSVGAAARGQYYLFDVNFGAPPPLAPHFPRPIRPEPPSSPPFSALTEPCMPLSGTANGAATAAAALAAAALAGAATADAALALAAAAAALAAAALAAAPLAAAAAAAATASEPAALAAALVTAAGRHARSRRSRRRRRRRSRPPPSLSGARLRPLSPRPLSPPSISNHGSACPTHTNQGHSSQHGHALLCICRKS